MGTWIAEHARSSSGFDVEIVDLKELDLPMYDEPHHPRLRQYEHEHTRRWSATVERGDAYLFVIPEYNFSAPPALVNALDYVFHEWAYKPAGMVSYGGVSAGLRSAQVVKQILQTLKIVALPEAVSVPFVQNVVSEDGAITANEQIRGGADAMLAELARWEIALRPLRDEARAAR